MNNVNIYAFADEASKDMDLQIEALKRNNLKGIEIRGVDGENVSVISLEKAKEVKAKLDEAGLVTWSIGSPIGKVSIDSDFDEHIEVFNNVLEVAKILDCKNVRMFSFHLPENANPDDYKDEVIEKLNKLCEIAKPHGISLCHENEKGIFGDTAERCLDILKGAPDLKGIFDPANFVQCDVDTLKAWDLLSDYIYYMHIKDAEESKAIVPAGEGIGNVKEITAKFIAKGGHNFTIEPHLKVFDGLKGLEKEGEASVVGQKYTYGSSDEAFDVACNSFKGLL